MDLGSIADLINEEAMKDMASGLVIEPLTAKLVDNEDIDKKIEDRRKFISSSAADKSFGLSAKPSEQKVQPSAESKPASSSSQSTPSYGTSYGYVYQQKPAETIQTKAREYSSKVLKHAAADINSEKKKEVEQKKQWNMFELAEKQTAKAKPEKQMTPKERLRYERHDAIKVAGIKSIIGVARVIIETLYMKFK